MLIGEQRENQIREIWKRIEEKCLEKNLKLISTIDKYKNNKTEIEFICEKHENKGIQYKTVNSFLDKDAGCEYCGREQSSLKNKLFHGITFERIFYEFNERGYDLIEDHYDNAKQQLYYRCRKHPKEIQHITYGKFSTGQGCRVCKYEKISEKLREDFSVVKKAFEDRNLILLTNNYINGDQSLEFICKKHKSKGIQITTYGSLKTSIFGCKYCAINSKSAERHHNWKGGITPLQNHLRTIIEPWKFDSFERSNRICSVTGIKSSENIIHHLFSFINIVRETLEELKCPIYNAVNKYNKEELKSIEDLCLKKHYERGLGVCLCNQVHDLFHSLYGKGDNTPEQWYDFVNKINSGEIIIPRN